MDSGHTRRTGPHNAHHLTVSPELTSCRSNATEDIQYLSNTTFEYALGSEYLISDILQFHVDAIEHDGLRPAIINTRSAQSAAWPEPGLDRASAGWQRGGETTSRPSVGSAPLRRLH